MGTQSKDYRGWRVKFDSELNQWLGVKPHYLTWLDGYKAATWPELRARIDCAIAGF
jgi:hypothetical protein